MPRQDEKDERSTLEVLIDLEISLVKAFQWSLVDIDETDVESLLEFVFRMGKQGVGGGGPMSTSGKQAYCDEVSWL